MQMSVFLSMSKDVVIRMDFPKKYLVDLAN